LSDFTKSLSTTRRGKVTSLGKRSVPVRVNLHCLRPKAEFANLSNRVLDWSEISFIKRKGILQTLRITGKKDASLKAPNLKYILYAVMTYYVNYCIWSVVFLYFMVYYMCCSSLIM
jgi:hypothetical protein